MSVIIEIYFHSDETSQASNLGMNYDLSECETRNGVFYNVDAVLPRKESINGKEIMLAEIVSGGSSFLSVETFDKVVYKIKNEHVKQ